MILKKFNPHLICCKNVRYFSNTTSKQILGFDPINLNYAINSPNPQKLSPESSKNKSIKNIVILHGLFGSLVNWRTIAQKLSDETNTNVITVDQRNHGVSPHTKEMSYDLMAKDLEMLISKNNLEKCCVIGHSMGGRVAMNSALFHPDIMERLIVVDVSPSNFQNPTINGFKVYMEGMNSMDMSKIKVRSDADRFLESFVPDKGVRQFLLTNLQLGDNDQYYWKNNIPSLLANISNISLFPVPSDNPQNLQFTKPTLFIRGEKSPYIQDRDTPIIKSFFPHSQITTIPNAGHWVHADDPKSFLKITSEFINK
ncbi:hypothetical protein DLAC_09317 [Tieghemostelium lacteum]|uniref:AB hydrolase-1 domain-containing protein n=1 Tax=Tieghemostelium lacteum TaxID=361077 RepID=A0A151Z9R2_TIELA|nr:hypothetical protein DLAC_09317 [Tieghemostelium lacteum]|eukprot:KYQ90681.1 hypothetical protein DLAC_09317 [Tieghemostelium lacteum]